MTPPDTNPKTQARRHRPAMIGIVVAMLLGGLFFLLNAVTAVDEEPEEDLPAGVEEDAATADDATLGTDGGAATTD